MAEMWANDLSERFGPMTVKELRQGTRRASFVAGFAGIHLLAIVALFADLRDGRADAAGMFLGLISPKMIVASGPFWIATAVVCGLLMPCAGFFLMSEELEDANHELLQLTPLDRWKIIFGKFLALWGSCALTLVSLLPYVVCRYMNGGIEWWNETGCMLTILVCSAVLCAGMIGASAFRTIGKRLAVVLLFLVAAWSGSGFVMLITAWRAGTGISYHLAVITTLACYVHFGLALARSRLRTARMPYEASPSLSLLVLLGISPFMFTLGAALTGFAGFLVPGALIFLIFRIDNRLGEKLRKQLPVTPALPPPPPLGRAARTEP